ncbi:hypothetical protein [Kingella sp. (in: b-proteobacteria)]|uniref:hypothetical protein n=1 Tax=Kingella sp. (in: b-proteobacteria) TaxID=2020713 RepID=UPI0026DCFCE1|nr:hypothetical protein [Kingella sp. (in: b-proteobacteria)]MDO4658713.1 hypothetical protein [Kingella sp. (in: b-proteobacteria)]
MKYFLIYSTITCARIAQPRAIRQHRQPEKPYTPFQAASILLATSHQLSPHNPYGF